MSDRLDAVRTAARQRGLRALLVSTPANTYYLTGFRALTYTRPVLLALTDDPVLIIPELEAAHARQRSRVRDIRTYSDLQLGGLGGKSPLHLALDLAVEVLRAQAIKQAVGFEPGGLTYEGHAYLHEIFPHLRPVGVVLHGRRVYLGVAEDGTVGSDYGDPGIDAGAEPLDQLIDVGLRGLVVEKRTHGIRHNICLRAEVGFGVGPHVGIDLADDVDAQRREGGDN